MELGKQSSVGISVHSLILELIFHESGDVDLLKVGVGSDANGREEERVW